MKVMSDDRQSWPIFSANKSGQQKSFICGEKSTDFVNQHRTCPILDDKMANFLDMGHYSNCLQWEMNICFIYFVCYSAMFIFVH